MRIHVISDLHLEFHKDDPDEWEAAADLLSCPKIARDVTVLAGDTDTGASGVRLAERFLEFGNVVCIPGNHEGYGHVWEEVIRDWKTESDRINSSRKEAGNRIAFLQDDSATFGNVKFYGTTLWTDFRNENPMEMMNAGICMNDYHRILIRDGDGTRTLDPAGSLSMHRRSIEWLTKEYAEPHDGPRVIVTHHLPSFRSVDDEYRTSSVNGAYASDLDEFILSMNPQPNLWIHGHTHVSKDYMIGKTRVICNPRGYWPHDINPGFRNDLTLDIP